MRISILSAAYALQYTFSMKVPFFKMVNEIVFDIINDRSYGPRVGPFF